MTSSMSSLSQVHLPSGNVFKLGTKLGKPDWKKRFVMHEGSAMNLYKDGGKLLDKDAIDLSSVEDVQECSLHDHCLVLSFRTGQQFHIRFEAQGNMFPEWNKHLPSLVAGYGDRGLQVGEKDQLMDGNRFTIVIHHAFNFTNPIRSRAGSGEEKYAVKKSPRSKSPRALTMIRNVITNTGSQQLRASLALRGYNGSAPVGEKFIPARVALKGADGKYEWNTPNITMNIPQDATTLRIKVKAEGERFFHHIPLKSFSRREFTHDFPLKSKAGNWCMINLTISAESESRQQAMKPSFPSVEQQSKNRMKGRPAGNLSLRVMLLPPCSGRFSGFLWIKPIEGSNHEYLAKTMSPYIKVILGGNVQQTKPATGVNPQFDQGVDNNLCFEVMSDMMTTSMEVLLFHAAPMGGHPLMGKQTIELSSLTSGGVWTTVELPLRIFPTDAAKGSSIGGLSPGRQFQTNGYRANFPVVLIPGFGASSLRIEATDQEKWLDKKVWLSLKRLILAKKEKGEAVDDDISLIESQWCRHMALGPQCVDLDNIRVRAVDGTDGCLYLWSKATSVQRNLSFIFGPLVEALSKVGYKEHENLLAFPYDWRVPFSLLSQRDRYFQKLKDGIESMEMPVIICAHSMGNRVTSYFFSWIKETMGKKWKSWMRGHINRWIAVAPPLMGAPKAARALSTGDRFGLEAFVTEKDANVLSQSWASLLGMLPSPESSIPIKLIPDRKPTLFAVVKSNGQMRPVSTAKVISKCCNLGRDHWNDIRETYYDQDELHSAIIQDPVMARVTAIFGTELETEVGYYIKLEGGRYVLDESASVSHLPDGYELRDGIVYARTGDGTIPYDSMNEASNWKHTTTIELPGAEHTEILREPRFLHTVLELVTLKRDAEFLDKESTKKEKEKQQAKQQAKKERPVSTNERDNVAVNRLKAGFSSQLSRVSRVSSRFRNNGDV